MATTQKCINELHRILNCIDYLVTSNADSGTHRWTEIEIDHFNIHEDSVKNARVEIWNKSCPPYIGTQFLSIAKVLFLMTGEQSILAETPSLWNMMSIHLDPHLGIAYFLTNPRITYPTTPEDLIQEFLIYPPPSECRTREYYLKIHPAIHSLATQLKEVKDIHASQDGQFESGKITNPLHEIEEETRTINNTPRKHEKIEGHDKRKKGKENLPHLDLGKKNSKEVESVKGNEDRKGRNSKTDDKKRTKSRFIERIKGKSKVTTEDKPKLNPGGYKTKKSDKDKGKLSNPNSPSLIPTFTRQPMSQVNSPNKPNPGQSTARSPKNQPVEKPAFSFEEDDCEEYEEDPKYFSMDEFIMDSPIPENFYAFRLDRRFIYNKVSTDSRMSAVVYNMLEKESDEEVIWRYLDINYLIPDSLEAMKLNVKSDSDTMIEVNALTELITHNVSEQIAKDVEKKFKVDTTQVEQLQLTIRNLTRLIESHHQQLISQGAVPPPVVDRPVYVPPVVQITAPVPVGQPKKRGIILP